MAHTIDEQDFVDEQQRLRDEVQRLRDEQQRLRDEQEKLRREAADASQPKPASAPPASPVEPAKKKGPSAVGLIILAVVLLALAVGGFFLWGYLSSYESTDDAQIDGHINSVSTRISAEPSSGGRRCNT